MIIVRYADDIVVGFEHETDARRFWDAMQKTVRGVRADAQSGQDAPDRVWPPCGGQTCGRGLGKSETFNFLGFTFICGRSRSGKFLVKRKSRRDRMRTKLKEIKEEMRRRRHQPIPEQGKWLAQVVRGYFAYHAVPTNSASIGACRHHVVDLWRRSLWRRSQRGGITWQRIKQMADDRLPGAKILHPWPQQRFAVRYRGRSRMPELRPYGSVRGAAGNSRPYRDLGRRLLSSSRTLHEHVELTFTRPETQFQEPPQPTTRSFSAVFANRALRRILDSFLARRTWICALRIAWRCVFMHTSST